MYARDPEVDKAINESKWYQDDPSSKNVEFVYRGQVYHVDWPIWSKFISRLISNNV